MPRIVAWGLKNWGAALHTYHIFLYGVISGGWSNHYISWTLCHKWNIWALYLKINQNWNQITNVMMLGFSYILTGYDVDNSLLFATLFLYIPSSEGCEECCTLKSITGPSITSAPCWISMNIIHIVYSPVEQSSTAYMFWIVYFNNI